MTTSTRMAAEGRSPEEYVEELKRLAANHVAGNVELASRVTRLAKEMTRSAGEPATPSEALSRWLDFNLASYEVLSAHSLALLDGLVTAAERTLFPEEAATRATPPPPAERVELRVSGRAGDRVIAPFVIENQYDRQLDVRFQAAALLPENGPPLPATLVEFEPETLSVAPVSEAIVQIAVVISDAFAPGETYRTTIRLVGYQAREVGLAVSVLPSEPREENEPAKKPIKRRRAPKKRGEGA